jgi:hypothetical protein
MDHDTWRIRLNRMLFTSTRYPAGYGFVEHTLADDGDALDALVILDEPAFAACPISCRAIGRRPPLNWPVGALVGDIRVWSGDVWVVDSTQAECVHSRDTVRRSDLADWPAYGYCASHSRYFWGLRLQMVATMHGLPVGRAGLTHIADKTATAVTSRRPWPALVSGRSQGRVLAWLQE